MDWIDAWMPRWQFAEVHHIRSTASPADDSGSGAAATVITTVSRLVCADDATRRRMALYWGLIRPASGLIRQRLLAQIKRVAEGR